MSKPLTARHTARQQAGRRLADLIREEATLLAVYPGLRFQRGWLVPSRTRSDVRNFSAPRGIFNKSRVS